MPLNANFVLKNSWQIRRWRHIYHQFIKWENANSRTSFHGQLCPAKLLTKKDMDQHITVHEGIKCPLCPEKFSKGADMSKHVTSVHAVKCQFCPAKFLKFKDMRNHIKKAHEANNQSTYPDSKSEKGRKCSICYKDKFYCLC